MRKVLVSLLVGLLMIAAIGLTVYSQGATQAETPEVQVLQGGISQQIPVDVTVLVPTETGVHTVTVPIVLNLNLTVGPMEAAGLDVQVDTTSPFLSPLTVSAPSIDSSVTVTP